MSFERRQFFREYDDPTVSGFTIIDTGEESYRIAEKWNRSDGEPVWTTYWITESKLEDRIESDGCEPVGNLTDDQFQRVCQNLDATVAERVVM